MKIATWNVNSLRQRLPHVIKWIDDAQPDVILMQETKVTDEQFPSIELEDKGYNLAFTGQKTFNGVAIISKYPIEDIITALPGDETDEQKRYIECLICTDKGAVRVASVYVPNGQAPDSDKFAYKMRFFDRLNAHTKKLLEDDTPLVVGGDYNVAPLPIDVLDPEKADGSICYHPDERAKLRSFEYLGLTNSYRMFHPNKDQSFSWWDYRAGAFQKNNGMLIDHLFLNAEAADICTGSDIDPTTRAWEKPSDHAPVWCKLKMPE